MKQLWEDLKYKAWCHWWTWKFGRHVKALLKLTPKQVAPHLVKMRWQAMQLENETLQKLVLMTATSIEMHVDMKYRYQP